MKIALDIDGCITRYPKVFAYLSNCWLDDVYILTYRPVNRARDEAELESLGIKYKDIIYANKDDDSKAKAIVELGIEVFCDDMAAFIQHVPEHVACMLVRNEDNFDYKSKQFLFTEWDGRLQLEYDDRKILKNVIDTLYMDYHSHQEDKLRAYTLLTSQVRWLINLLEKIARRNDVPED